MVPRQPSFKKQYVYEKSVAEWHSVWIVRSNLVHCVIHMETTFYFCHDVAAMKWEEHGYK